jgi:hypothetical protein
MERDPVDYELIIRYLDNSASDRELEQARELLLNSREARAYLTEVAAQTVHMIDRHKAYVELPDYLSKPLVCPLDIKTTKPTAKNAAKAQRKWAKLLTSQGRLLAFASVLLIVASLILSNFGDFRKSSIGVASMPSLQISDYLGEVTVSKDTQDFQSPFRESPRISVGDVVQSNSWLSWAELKLDSGATMTVLVNSRVRIKSLTKDRIEVEIYEGAVRIKAAQDDPFQFLVNSSRLQVATSRSDTLVWDYNFVPALTASFSGTAEVASVDGKQKVRVEADTMASINYGDEEFQIGPHPMIVHRWTSNGMTPLGLGTGIWKDPEQPGMVKLQASPKSYVYPDGKLHQIQEIMTAVWRAPGMVRLKNGSRLIVTGRNTKQSPISFSLRTHSEYGKLLDVFAKTIPVEKLPAPFETWRVEIPVEEMGSTYRPDQNSIGALLFNISVFSPEDIGLEVNSIDLIPPEEPQVE